MFTHFRFDTVLEHEEFGVADLMLLLRLRIQLSVTQPASGCLFSSIMRLWSRSIPSRRIMAAGFVCNMLQVLYSNELEIFVCSSVTVGVMLLIRWC